MKIAVVSSLTDYATCNYLVRALRRAGHPLLVISDVFSTEADIHASGTPDVAAIAKARGFVPELLFFVEGGSMQLFPTGLEHLKCPTAWYGIDTHTNYMRHLRIARLFDATFVAQKMFVERLSADGARRVEWLPLAFPSELFSDPEQTRPIDIAFVGSLDPAIYPDRVKLFKGAQQIVTRAEFGPASPAEMSTRYGQAKIVLNRSFNNDVNMRYFEAMGAGAVLLTDPVINNGAEDLFHAGEHYLVYRSESELLDSIRWLLGQPEKARAIGLAARKCVEAQHTYDHRVQQVLAVARALKKQTRPDAADYFAALVALNLPGPATGMAARAMANMGQGTRRQAINRVLGSAIAGIACVGNVLSRLTRRRAK